MAKTEPHDVLATHQPQSWHCLEQRRTAPRPSPSSWTSREMYQGSHPRPTARSNPPPRREAQALMRGTRWNFACQEKRQCETQKTPCRPKCRRKRPGRRKPGRCHRVQVASPLHVGIVIFRSTKCTGCDHALLSSSPPLPPLRKQANGTTCRDSSPPSRSAPDLPDTPERSNGIPLERPEVPEKRSRSDIPKERPEA